MASPSSLPLVNSSRAQRRILSEPHHIPQDKHDLNDLQVLHSEAMQHILDCPPILCHISHKYDSLGPGEYFHNPNIVVVICIYRKIDGVKGHGSAALNIITAMKLPFSSCSQANSAWVKQLFNKFPSSNHFVASIPLSCLWIQQHLPCIGSTFHSFQPWLRPPATPLSLPSCPPSSLPSVLLSLFPPWQGQVLWNSPSTMKTGT